MLRERFPDRGDEFHFFAESIYRDNRWHVAWEMTQRHSGQLVLIDAASKNNDQQQQRKVRRHKKAGHQVAQQSNPLIQDRINAVNVG